MIYLYIYISVSDISGLWELQNLSRTYLVWLPNICNLDQDKQQIIDEWINVQGTLLKPMQASIIKLIGFVTSNILGPI